jgi:cathepsin B
MQSAIIFAVLLVVAQCASFMDHQPVLRQQMIDAINSQEVGWKAGVNSKFTDLSVSQARRLMGALPEKVQLEESTIEIVQDIPDTFDARTQWPECKSIGHIRDQASCGSCWAFGAAEAWSDRVCIATSAKINDPMSTEDLLSCCGYSCGNGCNGGYLSGAWSYIKSTGLVTGGDYQENQFCSSYTIEPCEHHVNGTRPPCHDEKTPSCVKKCNNGAEWSNDKHKASKINSVTGEYRMQSEIMTNGPIEAAFTVYEDFLTYKSGVYSHQTGSYLGGHAIRVLGWGVEAGAKYWLVANSWNSDWGNEGYFKILRGSNECSIESQGYAGTL